MEPPAITLDRSLTVMLVVARWGLIPTTSGSWSYHEHTTTWRHEFLGCRSSTVEWPSTRASAAWELSLMYGRTSDKGGNLTDVLLIRNQFNRRRRWPLQS